MIPKEFDKFSERELISELFDLISKLKQEIREYKEENDSEITQIKRELYKIKEQLGF